MDSGDLFGVWLRNFRHEYNLTQEKLAERLGYSTDYIRKVESDNRPATDRIIARLAAIKGLQGGEYQEFINSMQNRFILSMRNDNPFPESTQQPQQELDTSETEDPAPGEPPYKGLNFFDVTDAQIYFGRKILIDELVSLLVKVSQGDSHFLTLIGASGSGKSSLVRAGLVPALKHRAIKGSNHWLIKILTPTAHPLKELAIALTERESDKETLQMIDDLAVDGRVLDTRASKVLINAGLTSSRLLLIVDQFEELFTLCKDAEKRRAYIDNLITAAQGAGPTIVLLTLRADFYRHCLAYEQLRILLEGHTKTIGAMSGEALREAIVGPAQAGGWKFDAGLVDLFLDDVGEEPGALPLLSHALRETWERRHGHTLTLPGYRNIGRVQGAIAMTADRVIVRLNDEQKLLAKRIFLRLTELGEGSEDTRRRVSLDELLPKGEESQNVEQVLKILADTRLITIYGDEVEVAHEALIREWPLLRAWLADNRESLSIHHRLTESANEWQNLGFDEGVLYRGVRLAQALHWTQENLGELNDLELNFLQASQSAVEAIKKAEEEARNRELDNQRLVAQEGAKRAKLAEERAKEKEIAATKLRTGRNFLIVASIIAVSFAILAGLFGVQSNRNATQADMQRVTAVAAQATSTAALATSEINRANAIAQQNIAEARATVVAAAQATAVVSAHLANADRIAAQARILNASTSPYDLDLALILASQAVTMTLVRENYVLANAEFALTEAIDAAQRSQWRQVLAFPHPTRVFSVAYSSDGQRLVTTCGDRTIRIWDVKSGKEIRQMAGHTDTVWSAAFSPDGLKLVTASTDKTGRIWDVATGKELRQLTGHTGIVWSAAFSPDGQKIVTTSNDRTARIWDVASGKELRQLIGHTGTVWSAAFSPDSQKIVTASIDRTARIWDVASGKELRQLTGHTGTVWSAAFSPDGQKIVTTSGPWILIWNVTSGQQLQRLNNLARSATFSRDGQQVVSASEDGTVRLWSVTSEKEIRQPISHQAGITSAAIFSPDGQQIVSASDDGTVHIWGAPINKGHQLIGHTSSVRSATFSPDGKLIASASEDTTIRLWDAKSGKELNQLTGHEQSVRSVMFSHDGTQLVSASQDETVRVWNVKSGKEVRKLTGHQGAVWSAVFSPDGRQIASGGEDTTVRIWDVNSGKEVRKLTGNEMSVWSVAFSPDGRWIVSACANGIVRIWDVATGKEVHKLVGHLYSTWSALFSPDGKQIVSAGDDGTVRIWDAASGKEARQLNGHTAGVRSAAFSPDGQQIASASTDKTIRIWDVATGKELRQLIGHTERALSVAYSPNGQQIISTSADKTVRIWATSIKALLTQAHALIQRNPPLLTTEERQLYGLE